MRNSRWHSLNAESLLFWALVVAYLVPIWAFRYFPTQDGPVHLASSIILKDYGKEGTRYHEFFELRAEPLPNWTAHLLLAGLMLVVPPLVTEKLLLSLYVLTFAGSLRYFCGAFGPSTRPCALVGLLFIYHRGIWLGFYNWDLSLVLALFVFGFWLWHRDHADLFTAAALSLFLMLTFFTHLVGFIIAAIGLGWFALTSPRQRWRNLGWATLAIMPAGLLTLDYLDRTGFFTTGAASGMWQQISPWFAGQGSWDRLWQDLASLEKEYFSQHIQGVLPMGWIALSLMILLVGATSAALVMDKPPPGSKATSVPRWPAAMLALGFLVIYVLIPDDLGEHGSFLKTRLALLPPLLFLGVLSLPALPAVRVALGILVSLVLVGNLGLVVERVEIDNLEIAEYTAARDTIGSGHILFVIHNDRPRNRRAIADAANPLLHASQYYALDGNLNLDNYQATVRYFPFRYRDGVTRGRHFMNMKHEQDADVVLVWDAGPQPRVPATFESIFNEGRLAVFAKTMKAD
jgi:hypothetical protein